MKTILITLAAILGSSQCYGHDTTNEKQAGKRRLGDPNYFSSTTESNPEVMDTTTSISAGFATSLFGKAWSTRKMTYFGGDEFIQMYDDQSETRVVMRGYVDLQVKSIEGVFIFNDREIHDVFGTHRGRAQGTCAHTSVGDPTYTCSIGLEILAEDDFVSAAFRSEGSLNFNAPVSEMTITGGHTELQGASGTMKLSPVSLDATTDPATPTNVAGAHQFEYLFFEAVLFVSSSFLANIMVDANAAAPEA